MARNTQIVMGSEDEDYKELETLAQKGKSGGWSCLKNTKDGDLLFIYFTKPRSAIVASATASGDAVDGYNWPYEVDIKDVELIEPWITLKKLRRSIPELDWLKSPQHNTYLDEDVARKLFKLAHVKRNPTTDSTVKIVGGGFGTAEQNRIVEKAARKAVRLHFEKKGYKFVSREKENLGYDFDATGKGETIHVEVKGASGSTIRFPITNNEVECAKVDAKFRLAVVTEATKKTRQVHLFSQREFLTGFTRTPIAYFAEMKRERVP